MSVDRNRRPVTPASEMRKDDSVSDEVSPAELNRATLDRQLLLQREDLSVVGAVERIAAVQAQEPGAVHVALWNRIERLDLADVDAAFERFDLVKASLMRITLHAVTAADYPAFHTASVPILRASRLNDDRYRITGLTTDDADAVVGDLVEFLAEPAPKKAIADHLASLANGSDEPRLWWALRTFAPVVHAPTGPPWVHDRAPWYVAAPPATSGRPQLDAALEHLVVRYLEAFGPATAHDVAQFSLQRVSVVKATLDRLGDRLTTLTGSSGESLFDAPDARPVPTGTVAAPPRLLSMWDSTLLAYKDRSRIVPEAYRKHVIRTNGDTLPTVLVDGHVAGVWRIDDDGVEVSMFEPLDADTHDRLVDEAESLAAAVGDRRPWPFTRYDRWWAKLPPDNHRTRLSGAA